jgi:hypothetical protein
VCVMCRLDSAGSGGGPAIGSCARGNEPSDYIETFLTSWATGKNANATLRIGGAVHPLPLHAFMSWTGSSLDFIFLPYSPGWAKIAQSV